MLQDSTNAAVHNDHYLKLLKKIITDMGRSCFQNTDYGPSELFLSLKVAFVHNTFVLTATPSQKPVIIFSRVVYLKKVIKINLPMLM